MKQLLLPFSKYNQSLGQLYYDKDPKEAEPEDLEILKDLSVFVSKEPNKIALRGVFFDKDNEKIVVSNGIVLLEIDTDQFKSHGVFPLNEKSVKGIMYPFYQNVIPTLDRSEKYIITTEDWFKHIKASLPLMETYKNEYKSKKAYLHFEKNRIVSYDMNNLILILKKAKEWGNKNIEVTFGLDETSKSNILLFYFKTPYGKCKALLINMFDGDNTSSYPDFLEKNMFSFNSITEVQVKGILSISKNDFYKPLETIDLLKKVTEDQAQRIRILAIKYKYQIQANLGVIELICIEYNSNDKIVRHKRQLTMVGKGLAYRKDEDDHSIFYEVYFVYNKTAVNIDRIYNDIGKLNKFVKDNPTYDFKINLYSTNSGYVGLHIIEFAKTIGWEYESLIARREAYITERKKKDQDEYDQKQKEQTIVKAKKRAVTLERVTAIQHSLVDNKQVSYNELIELIHNSTMKVNPRTMGSINNQNGEGYIGISTGNFVKKTSKSTATSIFEIAKQASTATIKIV